MIKEFIDAWEKNKGTLEGYFRTHIQEEYSEYSTLVKLLFDIVINPSVSKYDTNDIDVLDHGDWQGTQIFILHLDTYHPCASEYVYTHTYYGSCSGCDTLQAIHLYGYDKLPNDYQINDYMALCLHLLQRCKRMYSEEED